MHKLAETSQGPSLELVLKSASAEAHGLVEEEWLLQVQANKDQLLLLDFIAKSRARLSGFTFPFHFHALQKEMATHSSILAWRIPGTEEPGGLPSMGLHRVGHD